MNYLNAVFWDYAELTEPEIIRQRLQEGNQRVQRWILTRFLEHGRVVDTLAFFPLAAIAQELPHLRLTPYTSKKWRRMVEVYGRTERR